MEGFGVLAEETVIEKTRRSRKGEVGPKKPAFWGGQGFVVEGPYDAFCADFLLKAWKNDLEVWDDAEGGGFEFTYFKEKKWVGCVLDVFQVDDHLEVELKHRHGDRFHFYEVVGWFNEEFGSNWHTPPPYKAFPSTHVEMPVLMQHYENKDWPLLFSSLRYGEGWLQVAAMGAETFEHAAHKWRFAAEMLKVEVSAEFAAAVVRELGADVRDGHVRRYWLECAAQLGKRADCAEEIKKWVPLARRELDRNEMAGSCRAAAEIVALYPE